MKTRYRFGFDDALPLSVSWGELTSDFPAHGHDFDELLVISGGSAAHVADEVEFSIAAGDVFVMKEGQTHEFRQCRNLHVLNIQYEPRLLAAHLAELGALPGFNALFVVEPRRRGSRQFKSHLRLGAGQLKRTVALFQELQAELRDKPAGWRVLAEALFLAVVVHLSRCYDEGQRPDGDAMLALGKALARMGRDFPQPLLLRDLARDASMSVNSFLRAFKAVTGDSPIEYLLKERLRHGRELLLRGGGSLAEIATACGFNDSNYFSRQFKRRYGVSPAHYRKGRA